MALPAHDLSDTFDDELLGPLTPRERRWVLGPSAPPESGVFLTAPPALPSGAPAPSPDLVARGQVVRPLRSLPQVAVQLAATPSCGPFTVYRARPELAGRQAFDRVIRHVEQVRKTADLPGVVQVLEVAEMGLAVACESWSVGTATHLGALMWPLSQRLAQLIEICRTVRELHAEGIVLGQLSPAGIVLDDEMRGLVDVYTSSLPADAVAAAAASETNPFVAPEVAAGQPPQPESDVFCLGQLLRFYVTGEVPPAAADGPARALPHPDLERIAQRATEELTFARYESIDELLVALELAYLGLSGQAVPGIASSRRGGPEPVGSTLNASFFHDDDSALDDPLEGLHAQLQAPPLPRELRSGATGDDEVDEEWESLAPPRAPRLGAILLACVMVGAIAIAFLSTSSPPLRVAIVAAACGLVAVAILAWRGQLTAR